VIVRWRTRTGIEVGRFAIIILGIAAILFAIAGAWIAASASDSVPWLAVAGAGLVVMGGTWASARSWRALLAGTDSAVDPVKAYVASLPAKYLPGGIAQPIGLIVLTSGGRTSIGRVMAAAATQFVVSVFGGASLALPVTSFGSRVPVVYVLLTIAGMLVLLFFLPNWLPLLTVKMGQRLRLKVDDWIFPDKASTVRAYAWTFIGFVAMGTSFAIVVRALGSSAPWFTIIAAFAVAWTIGFLAVPLPAGVGAREGVLLALLAPWSGASVVIAASLLQRFASMLAELALFGTFRAWRVIKDLPS